MKRRPDLALFLPSLRGGGAERVMLELSGAFAQQGKQVDLVLARAEGVYLPQVPATVRVVDLASPRVLACIPKLVRYLRSEQPKALLSTLAHANVVALWAWRLAGASPRMIIREATTGSHPVYRLQSPVTFHLFRWLARRFYPWAGKIVAVSKGVSEDLINSLSLAPERIEVIYNPVATVELRELARAPVPHPWFQDNGMPVIVSVGRLTPEKDYPTLIRAFASIVDNRPARLVILGEGSERSGLEHLVDTLDLRECVDMPGFVANPFAYIARASVYVLSSVCEGMPNALIQAAVLGVPVVSTDCPSGPREILAGGAFGALVPVGEEQAIAAAVLRFLDQRPEPAAATAFEAFSLNAIVHAYGRLLWGSDG